MVVTKIRRNIKLMSTYKFFMGLSFVDVVAVLFFVEVTKSYALAMSVFTVVRILGALLEIPTGILSDKIGRRKTMVFASLFRLIGLIIGSYAGIYGSYYLLLISACSMGLAYSMFSGTDDALLYETMSELRKSNKYHEVFGKVNSVFNMAQAISAIAGGLVAYLYSYTHTVIITIFPALICLIIALFFVEPKIHKEVKHSSFAHLKEALIYMWRNKELRLFSVIDIAIGVTNDSSHTFLPAFFEQLIPVWLLGVVNMISKSISSVSFWFSAKLLNKYGKIRILTSCIFSSVLIRALAFYLNTVISPFIYVISSMFGAPEYVSLNNIKHEQFSEKQRATMGSITAFFGSFISGGSSILIGLIADMSSAVTALYVALIPQILALLLCNYIRRSKKS